jgi:hypothetical protein
MLEQEDVRVITIAGLSLLFILASLISAKLLMWQW